MIVAAAIALPTIALFLVTLYVTGGPGHRSATVARAALVPPGTNVLLVSVDTLRADHLPPFGYRDVEAPTVERLAREGVTFERAYTPAPLTLPAHVSMLTGRQPFAHGVRDNAGFRLEPGTPTLAEAFRAHGYRTGAFVSAFVLDSRWGLDRGFDAYFDDFDVKVADLTAMAAIQRPGSVTWAAARGWLASDAERPFFLWLHLFEPHTPYAPPEPFATRYRARPYDGEVAYVDTILKEVLDTLEERGLLDLTLIVLTADHGEGLGDHGEDEHGLLAYDATLHVPWLMRFPQARHAGTRIARPVSLVDVAPTLAELVGVPLAGTVDGESVAGLMADPEGGGSPFLYAEAFYARLHFGWSELQVVRDARFKYIRAPRPELYEYGRDSRESQNLADDHPEVVARLNRVLTAMTASAVPLTPASVDAETERRLAALGYVSAGGAREEPSSGSGIDPKDKVAVYHAFLEAREMLGTERATAGVARLEQIMLEEPALEQAVTALRDHWIATRQFDAGASRFALALKRQPDDPVLLRALASVLRAAGRYDAALATLAPLLNAESRDDGTLLLAGDIALDQGRFEAASGYLTRALSAMPRSDQIAVKLARASFHLGRDADAEALLAQTLARRPDASGAHYLLAQIAERRGDPMTAEAEYRKEIEGHPWDYQARFNLAVLLGRRGAFAEQAQLLDTIPDLAPGFHDVHFFRAKAYLDLGDPTRWPEAVAAARKGLQLAPESPSAPLGHYVLADVFALQGHTAAAEREVALGRALEGRQRRPAGGPGSP